MANDRLILVHLPTKRAFVLAGWSPSYGWEDHDKGRLADFLNEVTEVTPEMIGGEAKAADFRIVSESGDEGWMWRTNTPDPLTIEVKA